VLIKSNRKESLTLFGVAISAGHAILLEIITISQCIM